MIRSSMVSHVDNELRGSSSDNDRGTEPAKVPTCAHGQQPSTSCSGWLMYPDGCMSSLNGAVVHSREGGL